MSPSPAHLVFGATGQVGGELVQALAPLGRVVALSRPEVDFAAPETVLGALRACQPTVVWNAAADTSVDALECMPDHAFRVNAVTPGLIAQEARRLGAGLVHFSTDYVFDGSKDDPYTEDDAPSPLNVYGRSKLAGEQAIQRAGPAYVILRTSWVYATRGRNFLRAMARWGQQENVLRVVNDQLGAPTPAMSLARAAAVIARSWVTSRDAERVTGVYHLTAAGVTSWWGFACAIRDALVSRGVRWKADLVPVTTAEFPRPAPRPANSCLSNTRFAHTFGLSLPHWRDALYELLSMPGAVASLVAESEER